MGERCSRFELGNLINRYLRIRLFFFFKGKLTFRDWRLRKKKILVCKLLLQGNIYIHVKMMRHFSRMRARGW